MMGAGRGMSFACPIIGQRQVSRRSVNCPGRGRTPKEGSTCPILHTQTSAQSVRGTWRIGMPLDVLNAMSGVAKVACVQLMDVIASIARWACAGCIGIDNDAASRCMGKSESSNTPSERGHASILVRCMGANGSSSMLAPVFAPCIIRDCGLGVKSGKPHQR